VLSLRSRRHATGAIQPPRISFRDLLGEALAGVLARPARSLLTVLGTVVGITALVATIGLSKTAGNQIVGRFDELAATQVVVEQATTFGQTANPLTWDIEDALDRLNGVVASGAGAKVDVNGALVSAIPFGLDARNAEFPTPVIAATPGLFDAVRAKLSAGRTFDAGMSARGDRVAVLGPGAAAQLGINRVDNQPAIRIGEAYFTVIGILESTAREPDLLDAVIIPAGTANTLYGTAAPTRVVIDTEVGAARLIAGQARLALSPNNPDRLKASAPPEPRRTREGVANDVNSLFLVLGLVSLVVGAIGIANVTLVTVLERVGEIGLRRALGASRPHIAAQFLLESTAMGIAGGVMGASAGTILIVAISLARDWTPVMDPWVPLATPLLGAVIGLVAGVYPALRAASLEPVEALRAGI
jgi:ABC-type antimicrobial peptide transport system permease subunit